MHKCIAQINFGLNQISFYAFTSLRNTYADSAFLVCFPLLNTCIATWITDKTNCSTDSLLKCVDRYN